MVLLIVIDGLRVDYATPGLMPRLTALGAEGVVFENHYAAFPTLTQVNAATLVTGAWPSTHGILGNVILDSRLSADPLQVEWAGVLENLDRASGGRALTALTLGELIEGEDRDLLVVASGSSGLGWILGYGAEPRPGRTRIITPELVLPSESRAEIADTFGPVPPADSPGVERDAWAARLFMKLTERDRPDLGILWLSGPDGAQREDGVGSPKALEAVRAVDDELGRLLETLRQNRILDRTQILVTADHGFIRHTGVGALSETLASAGLGESLAKGDVLIVGNEIYLRGEAVNREEALVRSLALHPSVGALLTPGSRPGNPAGRVRGTLSYETINHDHERAGQILVVPNWSDEHSASDYPGLAPGAGAAGSGGASPYELQVPLVVAGPAFRSGSRISLPTAHVDLAPTMLRLLGIPVPGSMEGRVLSESLKEGEGSGNDPMRRTYRARMRFQGETERITELRQQGFEGVNYLRWIRALYRPPAHANAPDSPDATPELSAGE